MRPPETGVAVRRRANGNPLRETGARRRRLSVGNQEKEMQDKAFAAVREMLPKWQGHGVRTVAVKFRGSAAGGEIASVTASPADTAGAIDPAEVAILARSSLDERVPGWANRAGVDGSLDVHIAMGYLTLWYTRDEEEGTVMEQFCIGTEEADPAIRTVPIVLGAAPEDPLEGVRAALPAWCASGTRAVRVQFHARGSTVKLTESSVRPAPAAGFVRHSAVVRIVCEVLAGVLKRMRGTTSGAVVIDVETGTASLLQVERSTGNVARRRTLAIDTGKTVLA